MTYTIAIQEEAIIEMQEAFEWYENKRNGLGYELLAKIEACFLKISNNPAHNTHINETYRRIKTQKFPATARRYSLRCYRKRVACGFATVITN